LPRFLWSAKRDRRGFAYVGASFCPLGIELSKDGAFYSFVGLLRHLVVLLGFLLESFFDLVDDIPLLGFLEAYAEGFLEILELAYFLAIGFADKLGLLEK
jgi:hypothetical protein